MRNPGRHALRLYATSARIGARISLLALEKSLTLLQRKSVIALCFLAILLTIFIQPALQPLQDSVVRAVQGTAETPRLIGSSWNGFRSLLPGPRQREGQPSERTRGGGEISYELSGRDASSFYIDSSTGEVRLRESPDLEARRKALRDPYYRFDVVARRPEAPPTPMGQKILIEDIRAERPAIRGNLILSRLRENAPIGTLIWKPVGKAAENDRTERGRLAQLIAQMNKHLRAALLGTGILVTIVIPAALLVGLRLSREQHPVAWQILSAYMLLVAAQIASIPIALSYGNVGSEYYVGAAYSLLLILQLLGILWVVELDASLRWMRRLFQVQVAFWGMNLVGLLTTPF